MFCAQHVGSNGKCYESLPMSTSATLAIDTGNPTTTMPHEFGLHAFKEHLAFTFVFSTCGWINFVRPWLAQVLVDPPASLNSISGRALVIGTFGLHQNHEQLRMEATELYCAALHTLTEKISVASRTEACHLIAPVLTMIL